MFAVRQLIPAVGFEPTKYKQGILSASPLTARESWSLTLRNFRDKNALPIELLANQVGFEPTTTLFLITLTGT